MRYELTCTDCPFATVVEGDIDDLYEAIDSHRDETNGRYADHFVNVESLSA